MSEHRTNRHVLDGMRAALYDFEPKAVQAALQAAFAPDATVRLAHPFEDLEGAGGLWERALQPLAAAFPDLERRDFIVMAGPADGGNWVGCGGYYTGTFWNPFLEIPPTGHMASMRYHEFYRIEEGRVAEMQALWDIPELMMQAGAWPMAPSLGREWLVPAPATQDGLRRGEWDEAASRRSSATVVEMLTAMKRHPLEGGPEVMDMPRYWHPKMSWYGPAGIGTGRGIAGFRNWHQIPFLKAMPDRGQHVDEITYHFFGDGDYVGVTGWPDMIQTISDDGWMGMVPKGQRVTMRSLDFWRLENGLIRENWVLVDLLDVYTQVGVDVLGRMREFNKARRGGFPGFGELEA